MGLKLKKLFNELNVIIRAEDNNIVFYSGSDNKVKKMVFNIYFQGLKSDEKYEVRIGMTYLSNINLLINDDKEILNNLKLFNIGEYEVSKNGFIEKSKAPSTRLRERKESISITENFISDLTLTLENIELAEGLYEIFIEIEKKIVSTYSFQVKNY